MNQAPTNINQNLKKAGMLTLIEMSERHSLYQLPTPYFNAHHAWSSQTQIGGSNFPIEYAHGACDYDATKFVVINTPTHIWFINNGKYIEETIAINNFFGQKKDVAFSNSVTSKFGMGSSIITTARLGFVEKLYTSKPNQNEMYSVEYPEYINLDTLSDESYHSLIDNGDDVFIRKTKLSIDEYNSEFNEISNYLSFKPTFAVKIRKFVSHDNLIVPKWSQIKHILDMCFVNKPKFEYELIDLTKLKSDKKSSTQLYFPTHPTNKGVYRTNIDQLDSVFDKDGKQLYYIHKKMDRYGNIIENKFRAYQYKYLVEQQDGMLIPAKNMNSATGENYFKAGTKPSTIYNHFFDHTFKWIFSDNVYDRTKCGDEFNYSNMVFVLEEGTMPYNVIKTVGAGEDFFDSAANFHIQYLKDNPLKQHAGNAKAENALVESIYDIVAKNIKNSDTRKKIINSLIFILHSSGITDITIGMLENHLNHTLTSHTESGELDWVISIDTIKRIIIEAQPNNLDFSHIRQLNWQLDSFGDTTEIGIMLFEGNPKSATNAKKIQQMNDAFKYKKLPKLVEIWFISFDDLITQNTDNFVRCIQQNN
jgi:hypothetical protein